MHLAREEVVFQAPLLFITIVDLSLLYYFR
jgi:hypothetical protein